MATIRSQSYPGFSLDTAVEHARKIFDIDRRNPISREVAAKHLGYKSLNGAADRALATMNLFGLLEKVAIGEVRLSQRTIDILHPDSSGQRLEALRECANSPNLFQTIKARFEDGAPSPTALKSYLVRKNFNNRAIGPITTAYLKTCVFLDREQAAENGGSVGPYAEKSSLPEVKRRNDSDDSTFGIAVENSERSIPVSEIVDKAPETLPRPSTTATANGETEWMYNRLGPETNVRLMVQGNMGPKEIGKLIKLLEAQKSVLEDD